MSDDIIIREPLAVYRGVFHHKFCNQVIQHMRQGKSLASFAGVIGVSPSTIAKWAENNPEFAEAIEIARSVSLNKWEDIAIGQATGDIKGNSTTLGFMMKNQFPNEYKDKVNVETEGNISFMIDTGIPTIPTGNMLTIKDVEVDYEEIEDDGWESPDVDSPEEDLL